jgi:PilZ domain
MSRSQSEVSRREERIFVNLPVTMRTGWEGGLTVSGNTVDYSERGLRVRASHPLRVRQDVEVVVNTDNNRAKNYRVMWVRGPEGSLTEYEAGLELQA